MCFSGNRWPRLMGSAAVLVVGTLVSNHSGLLAQTAQQDRGSVVIRWNQAALDAIRITRSSPPVAARILAIAHTCMFDAWAAYEESATGTRMGGRLRRPIPERRTGNKEKAVSYAAYRALVDLVPSQ